MTWYTLMPHELMFPEGQEGQSAENSVQSTMLFNDIPVLVEQISPMEYKVVRVISTDPAHFMNADCCPGQILRAGHF
ncbi:YlzJ-like family protein [Fictibacillus sp. KIGAM418]|uniref:YlzJ-like family protein n=1 Tax=Fictibacillus marinisediminis TaxID=2878389 RepID=A0A9X2BF96_9BACL|nr:MULTISPECIES: YlzJ-like family protein [Fictibacillus]MCK6257067.1 YlzJ-like family protein [Fictibacillus marinisediminis]